MKQETTIETFPDGSTIETDSTSNRTVFGTLAHEEYIRRLKAEREAKGGAQ